MNVAFAALVRLEFLLLLRSRGLGILAAVTIGTVTLNLVLSSSDVAGILASIATSLLVVELPVLALVLSPMITRGWTHRGDVVWAAPVGLWTIAAARLTAAWLAVGGILLAGVLVASLFLSARSEWPLSNGIFLFESLIRLTLPVTWAQIAILHALAHLLRRTAWIALIGIGMTLVTALGAYMFVQHLLHPLNYVWVTLAFNTVVGLGADGLIQSRMAWMFWAVGFALWSASLLIVPLQDYRVYWPPRQGWFLSGSTAAILIVAATTIALYRQSYRASIVPRTQTSQVAVWQVDAVSHDVKLDAGELDVTTRLTLEFALPRTDDLHSVDLALNPGLQVQSARVNGEEAQAVRRGEVVALSWPDAVPLTTAAETVAVEVAYQGRPRLLREDYGSILALPYFPPSFRRQTASYVGPDTLFWTRDGDWLAWPLTPYTKRARAANELTVTVSQDFDGSLYSTADQIALNDIGQSPMEHRWSGPFPPLLMWTAPYRTLPDDSGELHLGRLQNQEEIGAAKEILDWVAKIQKAQGKPPMGLTLAVIPYGDRILFAPPYVGVPEARIQWAMLWDLEGEDSLLRVQLGEAIRLTEDWLAELLPWEERPMIFEGEVRGISEGRIPRNVQAPYQRWTENPASFIWHYAFAVVLAQRLLFSEHAAFVQSEREAWEHIQNIEGEILSSDLAYVGGDFYEFREPVGLYEYGENYAEFCALAMAITTLHTLADVHGDGFLWHWLQTLGEKIRADEVVDESDLWRVGAALAGAPLVPIAAPCQAYQG